MAQCPQLGEVPSKFMVPVVSEEAISQLMKQMDEEKTLTQGHLRAIRLVLGVTEAVQRGEIPQTHLGDGSVSDSDLILIYIILQRQEEELQDINFLLAQFDKKLLFYYLGGDSERGEMSVVEIALAFRNFLSRCLVSGSGPSTIEWTSQEQQAKFEQYQRELSAGNLKTEGAEPWFKQIQKPETTAQVDLPQTAVKSLVLQYLQILIEDPGHLGEEELRKSGLIWMEHLVDISKLRETIGNLAEGQAPALSSQDRDYLLTGLAKRETVLAGQRREGRAGGEGRREPQPVKAVRELATQAYSSEEARPEFRYPNEERIEREGIAKIFEKMDQRIQSKDITIEHLQLICALLGIQKLKPTDIFDKGRRLKLTGLVDVIKTKIRTTEPAMIGFDSLCLIDLILGVDKAHLVFLKDLFQQVRSSAPTVEDLPKAMAEVRQKVEAGEFNDKTRCEVTKKAEALRDSRQLKALHLIIIAHLIERNDLCERLVQAKGASREIRAVFKEIMTHIESHASELGLEKIYIVDFMLDLDKEDEAGMRQLYKSMTESTRQVSLANTVSMLRAFIRQNRTTTAFVRKAVSAEEPAPKNDRHTTQLRFPGLDFSKSEPGQ